MTHICVGNLTIIDPDNGLSPGRRQAIIRTNAGILLIEPLRTNFREILIEIHTFSLKEMHLKMSSGKWQPFCLGLNVLRRMGKGVRDNYKWQPSVQCQKMPQCWLFVAHDFHLWWKAKRTRGLTNKQRHLFSPHRTITCNVTKHDDLP